MSRRPASPRRLPEWRPWHYGSLLVIAVLAAVTLAELGAAGSKAAVVTATPTGEAAQREAAVSFATSTPTLVPSVTPTATVEPTATTPPPPTETPPPTPTPVLPPFEVSANAVAIVDPVCAALVFGKEEHTPMAPASLTKIVTALAVIDRVNLWDVVTSDISAKKLKQDTRSSVMGLEPDMRVTVEDLLYGLMLPSGNDAAIVLAKHVSGTEEEFARLMNETALELGLTNSKFDNPHGLDSPGLRSTAYDMVLAAMALMQNPTLAAISGAASYTLADGLEFKNGNKLLATYEGAYGVKIGYTRKAKYTIVAAAEREGRSLYVSVFGSEDLYNQTGDLLDWAFAQPSPCGA